MNDNRTSTPQITTHNCGPFSFSLIWLAQRTFDILTFEDKFRLASHTIDVVFPTLCSWDCLEVPILLTEPTVALVIQVRETGSTMGIGNLVYLTLKKKRREAIPDTQYFTYNISINGVLEGRHSPCCLAISKIQIKSNSVKITRKRTKNRENDWKKF